MGTVYMAEQEQPIARRVALKVIKPGMDSRQVIARFEAERQALSLMDHPSIAKVLDAGTTAGGRPYFVMELVKGIPITRFCDQEHLTPHERLPLFVTVCQAVQHAHQKGIIHRDLKPSNVLIALYDGVPVPKVIDFGVAKATGRRLAEQTMFTELGQIVGTLEYMSPEQAELNNLDIDTRADIYSLGVILYELLTGTRPFDAKRLREVAFAEMLRIIREEEPQKPSTRLSSSGDALPAISAQRKMEPAKLSKLLAGDLDWIVMKALAKERNRRYGSATDFAADLERFVNDEAVLAGPPTLAYKLRKFVRRNRAAVAAGLTIASLLVVGVAVTSWLAVVANRARDEAAEAVVAETEAKGKALDAAKAAKIARRAETVQRQQAEANAARADDTKNRALAQQKRAERLAREAKASALAAHARGSMEESHERALLLAIEAVETTTRAGEPAQRIAEQVLRDALAAIGGRPLASADWFCQFAVFSRDGRWVGGVCSDGKARLWDLTEEVPGTAPIELPHDGSRVTFLAGREGVGSHFDRLLAFSGDSRWLIAAADDGTVRFWETKTADRARSVATLAGDPAGESNFRVSPGGRWLVTWTAAADRTFRLLDLASAEIAASTIVLRPKVDRLDWPEFSTDDRRLFITNGSEGAGHLWDLTATDVTETVQIVPAPIRKWVFQGFHGSRWLVGNSRSPNTMDTTDLYDLETAERAAGADWLSLPGWIAEDPNHDRHWLLTFGNGTLYLWDTTASDGPQDSLELPIISNTGWLLSTNAAISPDSRWLAVLRGNRISLWNLRQSRSGTRSRTHAQGRIFCTRFNIHFVQRRF